MLRFWGWKIQLSQPGDGALAWDSSGWVMIWELMLMVKVVAWKFFELELGTCLWRRSRRFVSPTVLHLPRRTGGPMDCTCMEGCTKIAEAFQAWSLDILDAFLWSMPICRVLEPTTAGGSVPTSQRVIDQKHQHHEEQAAPVPVPRHGLSRRHGTDLTGTGGTFWSRGRASPAVEWSAQRLDL